MGGRNKIVRAVEASPARRQLRSADGLRMAMLALGLSAIAIVGVGMNQRSGLLTSPDVAVYVGVAESISNGGGLTIPFTPYTDANVKRPSESLRPAVKLKQWPPLQPAVLSLLLEAGLGWRDAIRVLNLSLVVVFTCLLALLVNQRTPGWSGVYVVLLLFVLTLLVPATLVTSPFPLLFASGLAEPLFSVLVLGSLAAMGAALAGKSLRLMYVAAVLVGVACTAKLLGIAVLPSIWGALLLGFHHLRLRERAVHFATCTAIAMLPVVPTLHSSQRRSASMIRADIWPSLEAIVRGASGLSTGPAQLICGTALLLGVGIASVWLARQLHKGAMGVSQYLTFTLPMLISGAMFVQLLYSHLFVDRFVSLVGRHATLPRTLLHLYILTVGVAVAKSVGAEALIRRLYIAMTVLWVSLVTIPAGAKLLADRQLPMTSSPILSESVVDRLGDTVIFSDAPDVLYLRDGLGSRLVPCRTDYYSGEPYESFDSDVAKLAGLIRHGSATAVFVGSRLGYSSDCASAFDFMDDVGIEFVTLPDGAILLRSRK